MDLRLVARAALAGELSETELERLWTAQAAARPRPAPGSPRCAPRAARAATARRTDPERRQRLERRRRIAASGWMPPTIAAQFTGGETAVLSVIGCQVVLHGRCDLTVGELARIAGVSPATVKRAIRRAVRLGILDRQERRLSWNRSESSLLTIRSAEWASWLRLRARRGVGVREDRPENRFFLSVLDADANSAGQSGRTALEGHKTRQGGHLRTARCRP